MFCILSQVLPTMTTLAAARPTPLTPNQIRGFIAAWGGWALDGMDSFIYSLVLVPALTELLPRSGIEATPGNIGFYGSVLFALFLIGWGMSMMWGPIADRFGRVRTLTLTILCYSLFTLLCGVATNLWELAAFRVLAGIGIGGEWFIGATFVAEEWPEDRRKMGAGYMHTGYYFGFFLAALANYVIGTNFGWRWMFMLGLVPALLVAFIRMGVEESPVFLARRHEEQPSAWRALANHWKRGLYLVVLMTAFTTLSHGTQDMYPTFLQEQHGLSTRWTGTLTLLMNVGAIVGALAFGAISHKLGRQRTIIAAAALAAPVIPLWAYGDGLVQLAVGAVLMQFAVQGAWSMVPAYLNELSPFAIRATFPGVVYQLGNLLSSRNVVFQADLAAARGGDYGFALAVVAGVTVAVLIVWTAFGPSPQDDMA